MIDGPSDARAATACDFASAELDRLISKCSIDMLEQLPGLHRADVEAIHDARVASRRLRAVLIHFERVIKKSNRKKLEKNARQVTRLLGRPRELDVTVGLVNSWRSELGGAFEASLALVEHHLMRQREETAPKVDECIVLLESDQFQHSRDRAILSARTLGECCSIYASRRLESRRDELAASYARWQRTAQEEDLHEVRIGFKNLRYSCEVAGPAYGREMKKIVKRLKKSQEMLGAWNDERLLREYMVEIGGDESRSGSLSEWVGRVDRKILVYLTQFEVVAAEFFSEPEQQALKVFFSDSWGCSCS